MQVICVDSELLNENVYKSQSQSRLVLEVYTLVLDIFHLL